jgi:hypothetical protein
MCNDYYPTPTLANCTFTGNSGATGGGMYNNFSCAPRLTNCTFLGNTASTGGGMQNDYSSSPTLTDCAFSDNAATGGGGMCNYASSSPGLTNCIFSANMSTVYGGGMLNMASSLPSLVNCAFSANSGASYGGGIYNQISSSPSLTNCILWGDTALIAAEVWNEDSGSHPSYSYCDVAGCGGSGVLWNVAMGVDAGGNIDANPVFVNAASGDLHLGATSPCIDAADGRAAPERDKDGNARYDAPAKPNVGIGPPWVDMGAYELQGPAAYTLGVQSTPIIGIQIVGLPAGVTDYSAQLAQGTAVILTAPAVAHDSSASYVVVNWVLDGVAKPRGLTALAFSLAHDSTAVAAYVESPLRLTYPTEAGITITRGATCVITWTSAAPLTKKSTFKVELVDSAETRWLLSAKAKNKGSLKWSTKKWKSKTQAVYPDGTDYKIRISSLTSDVLDESKEPFAIKTPMGFVQEVGPPIEE